MLAAPLLRDTAGRNPPIFLVLTWLDEVENCRTGKTIPGFLHAKSFFKWSRAIICQLLFFMLSAILDLKSYHVVTSGLVVYTAFEFPYLKVILFGWFIDEWCCVSYCLIVEETEYGLALKSDAVNICLFCYSCWRSAVLPTSTKERNYPRRRGCTVGMRDIDASGTSTVDQRRFRVR